MSERIPKVLILDQMGGHLSQRMTQLGCEPIIVNPHNLAQLTDLLKLHQPDWVHPGLGSWADQPELGILCQRQGAVYLGPSARAIATLSNRLSLLLLADRLRIPHLVLGFDPMHSVRELEQLLGGRLSPFPFVLKSVHGNSGHGLKVIREMEDLGPSLELWLTQLRVNYGESIVFIERYIEGARQIALSFARDREGNIQFFTPLDVSLQSHYRKLIEMCSNDLLDPKTTEQMQKHASHLLEQVSYVGLGTLEFLLDGDRLFLVGAKPRLQHSFVLWEKCDQVDAIALQLQIHVELKSIKKPKPNKNKKAIRALGVRIYAEDPILKLPRPGTIDQIIVAPVLSETPPEIPPKTSRNAAPPAATSVEPAALETHWIWTEHKKIDSNSDGLIGYLSVFEFAPNPEFAQTAAAGTQSAQTGWPALFKKTVQALKSVWISGSIETGIQFLIDVASNTWVGERMIHAGFLDEEYIPRIYPPPGWVEHAAQLLLLESHESKVPIEKIHWAGKTLLASKLLTTKKTVDPTRASVVELGWGRYRINLWTPEQGLWTLLLRLPQSQEILSSQVEGKIYAKWVLPGDWVEPHQDWIVIESMGVLVPHALSKGAYLKEWLTSDSEVHFGEGLAKLTHCR